MISDEASVRGLLAERTQGPHLILHEHPDLRLLVDRELTRAHYHAILANFLVIVQAAERQRSAVGHWSDLSLAPAIAALEYDLANVDGLDCVAVEMDWVTCPVSSLGMLYVLHGASFGGRVIAKNVQATLPAVSVRFFARGIEPALWRSLVDRLDCYRTQPLAIQCMTASAVATFQSFDRPMIA